jgi:hypothetical protein
VIGFEVKNDFFCSPSSGRFQLPAEEKLSFASMPRIIPEENLLKVGTYLRRLLQPL